LLAIDLRLSTGAAAIALAASVCPAKSAAAPKATPAASGKQTPAKKTAAAKPRARGKRYPGAIRRGLGVDLTAEIGYAFAIDTVARRFANRLRLGLLMVSEPWFLSVGATLEGGGVALLAGGLQVELVHLWTGFWAQSGLSVGEGLATGGGVHLFFNAAAGWSLFGFEYQRRLVGDGEESNAYILKLKAPLGVLFFGYLH